MKIFRLVVLHALFILLIPFYSFAGEDPHKLAADYLNKTPVKTFDASITLDEAMKIQDAFVEEISKTLGKKIGYKAALTNPEVQKRFGVTHPVRGVLLEGMILKSGTALKKDFGIRPMFEADLIMRVKNTAINTAKTPEEALKSLDAVIPFMELPDIIFSDGVKLTASAITAVNAGARLGIAGEPILLTDDPSWIKRLEEMSVTVTGDNGAILAEGRGSALMGHPLRSVLWIRDSLKAEGKELKKGDILSLGSITKMMPVKPGVVKITYTGLEPDKSAVVSVSFTE